MKIDKRVWIPVIGIYYAFKQGYILINDEWIKYQQMCCLLLLIGVVQYIANSIL